MTEQDLFHIGSTFHFRSAFSCRHYSLNGSTQRCSKQTRANDLQAPNRDVSVWIWSDWLPNKKTNYPQGTVSPAPINLSRVARGAAERGAWQCGGRALLCFFKYGRQCCWSACELGARGAALPPRGVKRGFLTSAQATEQPGSTRRPHHVHALTRTDDRSEWNWGEEREEGGGLPHTNCWAAELLPFNPPPPAFSSSSTDWTLGASGASSAVQ